MILVVKSATDLAMNYHLPSSNHSSTMNHPISCSVEPIQQPVATPETALFPRPQEDDELRKAVLLGCSEELLRGGLENWLGMGPLVALVV